MIKEQGDGGMPPKHLKGEALANWWRRQGGASMDRVPTLSNWERECPNCQDINPCTGNSTCISCNHSLAGAKRVPPRRSSRHSRPGE